MSAFVFILGFKVSFLTQISTGGVSFLLSTYTEKKNNPCDVCVFLQCLFSTHPMLRCLTQSKLPCGLLRATLDTPKVKIRASFPFSEQGMAILYNSGEGIKHF